MKSITVLLIFFLGFLMLNPLTLMAKREKKRFSPLAFTTQKREISAKELFKDKYFHNKVKLILSYEPKKVVITLKQFADLCRASAHLIRRDVQEHILHYEISISCTHSIPFKKTETVILPLSLHLSDNPYRRYVHLITERANTLNIKK